MLNYTKEKYALTFELIDAIETGDTAQLSISLNPAMQARDWLADGWSVLSMLVEVEENTYAVLCPFAGMDDMENKVKLINKIVPIYIADLSATDAIKDAHGCIIEDAALNHIRADLL